MKSDLSMESKYRSEGRHSLPRRRVATKTHCENGDFEMELSLAIQESLKYAKEKEGQLKRVHRESALLNGVTSDESLSRMTGKMLSSASNDQGSEELKQLKDLLLIHIELIQHQQELLTSKDKEIGVLRKEKDDLQCRLEKVERRVSLMKQKEELLEAQIAKEITETPPQVPPDKHKKITKLEATPRRKRQARQQVKLRKPAKVTKKSSQADKRCETELTSSDDESEVECESVEDEHGQEEKERSDNDVDESEGEEEMKAEEESKDPHPSPVLRTECLYPVTCFVDMPPEYPIDVPEEKEVCTGEFVETPGWRIKMLTNRYQLEGTENITDEAYQKRHQKHEMEEKRRKRWDIQRMREQRVFEKLRGKQEKAARTSQEEKGDIQTFLPFIDELSHIEILDSVPVMVFGQAVPHIEPSEFELPWDATRSALGRKSHSVRGRQK